MQETRKPTRAIGEPWEYFRERDGGGLEQEEEQNEEEYELIVARKRLSRELTDWMMGLGVRLPDGIDLEAKVIEEFKDG